MVGYVKIPRVLFDDPAFSSLKFSRPWAVIDLYQLAKYKDCKEYVNGRYVNLKRGQFCKSIRDLSDRWRWDEKTVSNLLNDLVCDGIIEKVIIHPKRGITTIYSIVNYDKLQDDSNTDSVTNSNADSDSESHTDSHANSDDINSNTSNTSELEETSSNEDAKKFSPRDVVELWNSICTRMPKVRALPNTRAEKIRSRLKEFVIFDFGSDAKEVTKTLFEKVNASDFLCKGNPNSTEHRNWKADFDWVFKNDKNWVLVMENRYNNDRQSQQDQLFSQEQPTQEQPPQEEPKPKRTISISYINSNYKKAWMDDEQWQREFENTIKAHKDAGYEIIYDE